MTAKILTLYHLLTLLWMSTYSYSGGPFNTCEIISNTDEKGIVRLFVLRNTEESSIGTGTVISINNNDLQSRYILTNAHCVDGTLIECATYTFTQHPIFGRRDTILPRYPVDTVIHHPQASDTINGVDLALVILDEPIENKKPFYIDPQPPFLVSNKSYCVDGFGTTAQFNGRTFDLFDRIYPLRKRVYCGETLVSETFEGREYKNTPFYHSYYILPELMTEEVRKDLLTRYNDLEPSENFILKGDSGGPLYNPETLSLLGISTMGNLEAISQIDLFPQKPLEVFFTPLDTNIRQWIIETIISQETHTDFPL